MTHRAVVAGSSVDILQKSFGVQARVPWLPVYSIALVQYYRHYKDSVEKAIIIITLYNDTVCKNAHKEQKLWEHWY